MPLPVAVDLAKDRLMPPSEPRDDELHDGIVKFYIEEKGWGAIASDALPLGRDAWVHFSMIDMPGYRSLQQGQVVRFAFKQAKQESFDYVATYVRVR
jgi:CspA family cold shock protein